MRACTATGTGGGVRFEGGATGQVGQSTLCGGTPNNLSGSYTNLGGNSSTSACAACETIAWRQPVDCDADGQVDGCEIASDPALDGNGDGLLDTCPSDADLLVAIWTDECGGNGSAFEVVRPASPVNWSTAAAQARRPFAILPDADARRDGRRPTVDVGGRRSAVGNSRRAVR